MYDLAMLYKYSKAEHCFALLGWSHVEVSHIYKTSFNFPIILFAFIWFLSNFYYIRSLSVSVRVPYLRVRAL